jgi:Cu/Ag efflux protein CusF
MNMLRFVLMTALSLAIVDGAAAQRAEPRPAETAAEAAPVTTYARLTSVEKEPDGKLYVRLKLLPKAKLPFTVQRFRVRDRSLLAGIAEGSWVRFTAKHIDGENTLTSIRITAECKRFQECR